VTEEADDQGQIEGGFPTRYTFQKDAAIKTGEAGKTEESLLISRLAKMGEAALIGGAALQSPALSDNYS
jgi:hypothetical protein